jgi:cytochrome c peroxidase
MRQTRFIALAVAFGMIVIAMSISAHIVPRQDEGTAAGPAPVYNPYPPGILPSDLSSEITRVQREVDLIEVRALARWKGLSHPILTGQPPVLQNTGTETIETLGELMLYDRKISPGKNQACESCHMPYVGFSGPIPRST